MLIQSLLVACCTFSCRKKKKRERRRNRGGEGEREREKARETERIHFKIQQVVRLTVTMLPNALASTIVSVKKRDSVLVAIFNVSNIRREVCVSQNEFGSSSGYVSVNALTNNLFEFVISVYACGMCVFVVV